MDNVLYQMSIRYSEEEKESIILTEEVNRLIVWKSTWEGEDETLLVLQHFPPYQKYKAVEFAVDAGRRLEGVKT